MSARDELFIYLLYNRAVTMDEVIGSYKVDMQQEGWYKKGTQLDKFVQDERL